MCLLRRRDISCSVACFSRLCLVLAVVLSVGMTTASTPTACAEVHCVYLPLVLTPELVAVSNVERRGTQYEDTIVISGEIHAMTSTPVYSVTLEVRSYDSQGHLLDITTGNGLPFVATLPRQPNPFYLGIGATEEQDPARIDVRVIGFSRIHPRTFLPVTVTVTSYKNVGGYIVLAGTLTNESALPLEAIGGVASTESGGDQRHVRAFAPRLAPFETVPFSTSIDNVNYYPGSDVPYKIIAQGVVP
jgi:hypothetical protein